MTLEKKGPKVSNNLEAYIIRQHQLLQFFNAFLNVTKIHNFLSVLKHVAKLVKISQYPYLRII